MRKNKKILLLMTFIVIEILFILVFQHFHKNEVNKHLQKHTNKLEIEYNKIERTFEMMTKTFVSQIVIRPEIMELYNEAYLASPEKKQKIRDSLYNMLIINYEYLKIQNIRQLHFHLPNNESFLRFHRPHKFGDNLTNYRYSVKMTNKNKRHYSGFEEGRIFNGFRYVFPLYYKTKHIGSVETSFSFKAIELQLKQDDNKYIGFMVKKDIVDSKVFENENNNYILSKLSDNYVHEKVFLHYNIENKDFLEQIDEEISHKIQKQLSKNLNFSIYYNKGGHNYTISFISIPNVEGNPVAYIFTYNNCEVISSINNRFIIILILGFLLIGIIGFSVNEIVKRNLKIKKIDTQYKEVINANADIVIVIDKKGNQLFYNKQLETLLGYEKEEIQNKSFIKYISKDKRSKLLKILEEIFSQKGITTIESSALHKNGHSIPIEITAKTMIFDEQTAIVCTLRNINDRKETEQLQKENETIYRRIIESTLEGYWAIDSENTTIEVNKSLCDMLEYSEEEMLGKKSLELVDDDSYFFYMSQLKKIPYTEHRNYEITLVSKTDKKVQVIMNASTIRDSVGKTLKSFAFVTDITNQKKYEEKLQQSENELIKAQKIGKIGTWKIDLITNKIEWNDILHQIVEHKGTKPMTEAEFSEIVIPEDRENAWQSWKQAIKGIPYDIVYRINVNGKIKWLREIVEIMLGYNNIPLSATGVILNITKHKNTELALKKSETKLIESNKTKDKFFSIIAHDLRSPFNALLGFSDILLKNYNEFNEQKQKEIIKTLNISANNAFELLDNLLTWSRAQSGKIEYNPEKLFINDVLSKTINNLNLQAENKKISIINTISNDNIISADKNLLATIFRNLITNAIKFTNKNGTIQIASQESEKSDFIQISVTDTGIGISEEKINNLFLVEKNTSTAGTENETGTGLGLVLCEEFIKKHKGEIWVESKIGKGSTFIFTMPKG